MALGLLAALRLSGRDTAEVERELDPRPVAVDPERAWQALLRDKKRTGDAINLVLLGDGRPLRRAAAGRRGAARARTADRVDSSAMQVLVLNGVNLDMLAHRDPAIYGGLSINELETQIYEWARELALTARCQQTNHEGEYIDWIHNALRRRRRR